MGRDFEAVDGAPASRFCADAGDFSFLAAGDGAIYIRTGRRVDRQTDSSQESRVWERVLAHTCELASELPTHYYHVDKSVSRLDRVYLALPSWVIRLMHVDIQVPIDIVIMNGKRLPDHGAVSVTLSSVLRTKFQ